MSSPLKPKTAPKFQLRRSDWLIAVGLAGAALYLRRKGLAPSSLWLDDAWQALVYRSENLSDVRLVTISSPGFTFGLWVWLKLAGFSELMAQIPTLILGLATPPAAYLVARSRGLSVWAALVAGVLLVASGTHARYSTRVKQYTLDAALALSIIGVAWSIIDNGPTKRRWGTLFGVAVGSTMMTGAVAPVAAGGFVAALAAALTRYRRGWVSGSVAGVAYGAFGLLWWKLVLAPAMTGPLLEFFRSSYISTHSFSNFTRSLSDSLGGLAAGFAPLPRWTTALGLVSALVVVSSGFARRRFRGWYLALLFGFPIVVAIGLASLKLAPLGAGRTDIYLYPGLALLIATGFETLRSWSPRVLTAVGVLGVIALLVIAPGVRSYPNEDVRPLIEVLDVRQGEDRLIVYPATRWAYALYNPNPVIFVASDKQPTGFDIDVEDERVFVTGEHRDQPEQYLAELARFTSEQTTVWFVATHWRDDLEVIEKQFEELGFAPFQRWERPGALLIHWKREDASS